METIFLLMLLVVAGFALISSVRIVNQYEKGVVLRLGKYKSTADSGIIFILPFIEHMIKVDMRERVINVEPQKVITKDNVTATVDAVIYYKVVDPVKAEFEVEDFGLAATTLAQTNLRNLVGDKSLDEALVARDLINTNLREVLDEATHGWGVKVTRVEVQKIEPSQDITDAMSGQMKAEREKRATILTAEGDRQSKMLMAEGEAMARTIKAEAEANAIKMVSEAAEKYFSERPALLKKLEVNQAVLSGNSTKWVLPANSDLINVLNLSDEKVLPIPKKS